MEETKEINTLEVIQEPKSTGIVPVTVAEYFNLLPDPEKVAQRADATKKMLASLCKAASPANIVNFGGKPYFDHLACERIAKIVGLVIKINEKNGRIDYEKVIEDEAKNKYTIYLTGKVYYTNRPDDYEIQEGSSSSFDDWYKEYQIIEEQETEDGKKKKVVISANALPEAKVREKARANLIQRLVKKFLGLDFTWEELEAVGIDRNKFFNAGMLVINCDQFRKNNVLDRFIKLLGEYNFVVTQDEDYLNVICKNRVLWIDQKWNTEVFGNIPVKEEDICMIHYIMVAKPWHFTNVRLEDKFWNYAKKTEVYDDIVKVLEEYTDEMRQSDLASCDRLAQTAIAETKREDHYMNRKNAHLIKRGRVINLSELKNLLA